MKRSIPKKHNNIYDRVIAKLNLGKPVTRAELSQAWSECPTSTPPKIFREYTASVIEQLDEELQFLLRWEAADAKKAQ